MSFVAKAIRVAVEGCRSLVGKARFGEMNKVGKFLPLFALIRS